MNHQNLTINSLSRRAKEFFFEAHKNQMYGDLTYDFHLEHVADVARRFAERANLNYYQTEVAIAAAYGHDSVSDACQTYNDINKALKNERVAQLCCNLCEDVWGINRDERNSPAYYARINSDMLSVYVKVCDRIANIEFSLTTKSRMFAMYSKEHKEFKSKLYNSEHVALWSYIEDLLQYKDEYEK